MKLRVTFDIEIAPDTDDFNMNMISEQHISSITERIASNLEHALSRISIYPQESGQTIEYSFKSKVNVLSFEELLDVGTTAVFNGRTNNDAPYGHLSMVHGSCPKEILRKEGAPHNCESFYNSEHCLTTDAMSIVGMQGTGLNVSIIDVVHERLFKIRFHKSIISLDSEVGQFECTDFWVDMNYLIGSL